MKATPVQPRPSSRAPPDRTAPPDSAECRVYCIVPHPEQLDPLLARLRNAGVPRENIRVLPRQAAIEPAAVCRPGIPLWWQAWWELYWLPLTWPLAFPAPPPVKTEPADPGASTRVDGDGAVVVPLARYRAQSGR